MFDGTNFQDGATSRLRSSQINGHAAEQPILCLPDHLRQSLKLHPCCEHRQVSVNPLIMRKSVFNRLCKSFLAKQQHFFAFHLPLPFIRLWPIQSIPEVLQKRPQKRVLQCENDGVEFLKENKGLRLYESAQMLI